MEKVHIVGMGMGPRDLTPDQLAVIRSAEILVAGRRHLSYFQDLDVEKQVISGRMDAVVSFIRANRPERRIVVLASGDPLFFGIGERLVRELGAEQVTILPNITAVSAAFAKINEPWSEARVISLHGRDREFEVLAALKERAPVAVLTDPRHTPGWLAGWLLERGVESGRMAVFENLGAADETFGWYRLEEAAGKTFADPNVVILKGPAGGSDTLALTMGMPDEAFFHEAGLITKPEVRAVTLAKLRLRPGLTLWDLGAGSGSVGLEASVLLGPGRIVAVERDAGRVDQIRQNARRYGVYNHEVVHGTLPGCLGDLPRPHRVFIGGGGRDLAGIVKEVLRVLEPDGRVVVNTVLVDNLVRITDTFERNDMPFEITQVQVCSAKEMPWSRRFAAQNPVWIISGRRPEERKR